MAVLPCDGMQIKNSGQKASSYIRWHYTQNNIANASLDADKQIKYFGIRQTLENKI